MGVLAGTGGGRKQKTQGLPQWAVGGGHEDASVKKGCLQVVRFVSESEGSLPWGI